MYIFAFIFFLFTYIVNKILLLQYYKKNKSFTVDIPADCAGQFKYAIFLKLFIGFFMFLNSKILWLKDSSQYKTMTHEILYICLACVYFYIYFGGASTIRLIVSNF